MYNNKLRNGAVRVTVYTVPYQLKKGSFGCFIMNNPDPAGRGIPREKSSPFLFAAYIILAALIMMLFTGAFSAVIVRNLDHVILKLYPHFGMDPGEAGRLAGALESSFASSGASVDIHLLVPALCALAFAAFCGFYLRRKRVRVPFVMVCAVCAVVLFAFSLGTSVYLTETDGITVGEIISSVI